jgi:hypothetical protein
VDNEEEKYLWEVIRRRGEGSDGDVRLMVMKTNVEYKKG